MLAAQLLNQAVVSAAAADGALCAYAVGDELKDGLGVVVETAHDCGVDGVFNACAAEIFLNLSKVRLALLAEVVGDFGSVLCDCLVLGTFAVEQTHGIFLKTAQAGGAELPAVAAEVVAQRLIVLCAAFGTADGVYLKPYLVKTESVENRLRRADKLRVGNGRLRAVLLKTELVELSESACLRLLVAVAGNEVARLYRQTLVFEVVLKHRSRRARGTFGTQGNALAALCVEGVHLLLNDVGRLTHAAREELCVLKDRRADLLEAVCLRLLAHDALDELPAVALTGQHVLGALDFLRD